jgi:hypothetical protein
MGNCFTQTPYQELSKYAKQYQKILTHYHQIYSINWDKPGKKQKKKLNYDENIIPKNVSYLNNPHNNAV